MQRIRLVVLVLLASLALSFPATATWARDSLDAMLTPYLARHGLPALAAAVAVRGEIVAAGAVGVRRAGTDIPVTLDDRFHIGSDTKAMTALLAAILVEWGKLRWDSTPAQVFPELAADMDPGFAAVTLESLLSHTSGLPSDNEEVGELLVKAMAQDGNLDDMRRYIVAEWGKRAPSADKSFAYSNIGYTIAGAMIERAGGSTWDELIVNRVFEPLDMTTAGLGPQASLGKVDAPLGHRLTDGKAAPVLSGPNADNPAVMGPAGIAHMSILDFCRWAAWNAGEGQRGPALVSPQTLRKLHAPVARISTKDAKDKDQAYALGWGVVTTDRSPAPVLQHAGSNTMNLAQIVVDPASDTAIVLAANIAGEQADKALSELVTALYRQYAGQGGKR